MKNYLDLFQSSIYSFDSKNNILEEKDLGICADIASVMTPEHSVASLDRMMGCPYSNAAFHFDVITDGEKVKCDSWQWLPNAMYRHGKAANFSMDTLTVVVPGMRSIIQKITYTNKLEADQTVPIQVMYRGCARKDILWPFTPPQPSKGDLGNYASEGRVLIGRTYKRTDPVTCYPDPDQGLPAFRLTTSLKNIKMFPNAYLWEDEITMPANGTMDVYFSANLGSDDLSKKEADLTIDRYEELIEKSFDYLKKEINRIETQLPRLTSDVPELDNLFYRALVTYIMCRWENPDLCTVPYFSTGSVNGSCMCSYLWDYCGGLMMHPLYDPDGNKKNLKAYLRNDLTKSFALNPVTGGPTGPWYQVNHEKIICMVYYHVLFTGDKEFLFEKVADKTVLEWMRFHAYVCDDVTKDIALYDYGEGGKAHLELRREYVYNGIMPDLNARRFMNYMRVYALTVAAGQPDELLPKRAALLKKKLKELWNEEKKWYDFINKDGVRDIRYTVQMFKFLNSYVIDAHEREGLISHLNETEFLSKFGLHSMSKLDEAYDQDDIDNGGGGICTHFTMQICAQLYEMGYDKLATDILQRVYWWGTRMPYMGDSCAANMIANREDTPLQGDISSVSCAQMIFYYIFGIRADFDGNITVCPVKNRPAKHMKIENARLCGKVFCVDIHDDIFTVSINGTVYHANIGETIQI